MTEKYTGNLVQGKGYGTLRGIIVGKDSPRKGFEYEEKPDKNGKKYRKMKLQIKTSENNIITTELFGGVRDEVYAYNSKTKESKKIAWAKRNDKLPDGFTFINPVEFDLVKDVHENYKDGDSVFVKIEPQFSTYEGQDGKVKQQVKFAVKNIYKATEPVNFAAENFVEEAKFVQDIVIRDVSEDTKEKKLYVSAYVILYGGKFEPAEFIVDTEVNAKFAKNIKALKFGDSIRVNGVIQNRALTTEVEEDDGWGTKARTAINIFKALEITGADGDSLQKKLYKEEDFVKNDTESTFNGTGDVAKKVLEQLEKEQTEGSSELPFDLDE
jgi:hypothetical protein